MISPNSVIRSAHWYIYLLYREYSQKKWDKQSKEEIKKVDRIFIGGQ
jgi:hypothetical protein